MFENQFSGFGAYQSPTMPYPQQVGFQPPQYKQQYQPTPPAQQTAQPQPDERIFVANSAAAEAYLLAPNSFVRLWDSQKPYFYERQTDASGRQFPMQIYRYERCDITAEQPQNGFEERFKRLEEKVAALEQRKQSARKKDEVTSDE